jgi:PTH1 family peptidyl-tRNA hydrolase
MQPETHPDGITFINDHAKAPFWSIPPALRFMKEASARRKIVVIGHISDFTGYSDGKYTSVARQALTVADHVVFVGPYASKCLKVRRHPQDQRLQAFNSVEAASEYLNGLLQPGDLVLLKGGWRDRLREINQIRVTEAERPSVQHLHEVVPNPQDPAAGSSRSSDCFQNHEVGGERGGADLPPTALPVQAVVGLGNVGEEYRDTPHNVGQRVLDLLASRLRGEWKQFDHALVATIEYQGRTVHLVKPLTSVNRSGPIVFQLGSQLGFGPAASILIHDDINLPLGTVRMRLRRSSDGGHRGIRSILQAFRTDEVRRVKIGVGQGNTDRILDYVLAPLSLAALSTLDNACTEAADRVLEMVMSWPTASNSHIAERPMGP